MDKLTAARVLLDVAQTESFTATADRLAMSRPMVTRYVEAMENWLGARLLNRTTRKVSLTNMGKQVLPDMQRWVEQALHLEESLMPGESLSGFIRISTSMSFGFSQLMPALHKFRECHPGVIIDIDAQDRAVDLVAERVDLAIRTASNPDPSLIGRPLAPCESTLVASPAYLKSKPPIKVPEDLREHECLGYKNFGRHEWHLTQGHNKCSIEVTCHITGNEATVLLHGSLAGMGISMQPTYLVEEMIEKGELEVVLPEWELNTLTIYLLYASRKHLSRPVRALIDFLVEYFDGKF
ncbi:LysR family transcriptional regulator [Enterovibrio sp. ZSDZ42]|uniref:LysR family transcriptional regulator n=1 Tax=Enterovibrio gelatinilyticus TaxID=2899819 RepID=A0ABT5R1V9_9GAMM|nr:LysR family transcriptional regulator [Enterovibrio sp. ZSDZ42]MDD1794009.1 LysR family transcriptional regulator [Enterovibrio sp. ZSDZ42]